MMKNFFRRKDNSQSDSGRWLTLLAPVQGEVVSLDVVPDPVFSQRMVGDGVAIDPTGDIVVAPVAGTLTNLYPTGHAAGITTPAGIEILIHIGVDTVKLKGEGFTLLAQQGQRVEAGTPLIRLNLAQLKQTAQSTLTPVIITTMPKVRELQTPAAGTVQAGVDVILRVLLA